jgi:hypothetical protein
MSENSQKAAAGQRHHSASNLLVWRELLEHGRAALSGLAKSW